MHPAPSHLHQMTTAELRDYAADLAETNAHEPNTWTMERAWEIREILAERAAAEQTMPAGLTFDDGTVVRGPSPRPNVIVGPRVHALSDFDPYAVTQTSDEMRDGDVFTVEGTDVIGILVGAWPVVVHGYGERFGMHRMEDGADIRALGASPWGRLFVDIPGAEYIAPKGGTDYSASVDLAAAIAQGITEEEVRSSADDILAPFVPLRDRREMRTDALVALILVHLPQYHGSHLSGLRAARHLATNPSPACPVCAAPCPNDALYCDDCGHPVA